MVTLLKLKKKDYTPFRHASITGKFECDYEKGKIVVLFTTSRRSRKFSNFASKTRAYFSNFKIIFQH